MSVALLIGAVIVLMVGLPLGAVGWSRARHLRRPPAASWTDLLYAEARRQHLTAQQIAEVTQAVNAGAAAPVGLRTVTAQAADAKAAWLESVLRPPRRGQWFAIAVVLLLIGGGAVIAFIISGRLAAGGLTAVPIVFISTLATRLMWRSQLRRSRRAVELNKAPELDENATSRGSLNRG